MLRYGGYTRVMAAAMRREAVRHHKRAMDCLRVYKAPELARQFEEGAKALRAEARRCMKELI